MAMIVIYFATLKIKIPTQGLFLENWTPILEIGNNGSRDVSLFTISISIYH